MDSKKLSGIERDLVVQYLIDGNVPVTITPETEKTNSEDEIRSLSSQIFPVAIKPDQIKVHENGILILENPPQSIKSFEQKNVKVEFYFNRVGLYFNSKISESNNSVSILIPQEICRITDVVEEKKYDFNALIYFECKTGKELMMNCIPWDNIQLFNRPVWKSIPLENQKKAKSLLEKYVAEAKLEKNAGNGIQLIPVCNYLTYQNSLKIESLQDRIKPINVLYVDHERIVLALDSINYNFILNDEYGIKLSFSIKEGPIVSRDIYITCFVNKLYKSETDNRVCVDCRYTTIQEEDLRFLYEKATCSLFV